MAENYICKEHSGIVARVQEVERQNSLQWEEINTMKRYVVATLTSSIIAGIGVVVMLIIQFVKMSGGT